VANSDTDDPLWLVLTLDEDGNVVSSQEFLSARPFQAGGSRIGMSPRSSNLMGRCCSCGGNIFGKDRMAVTCRSLSCEDEWL